MFETIAKAFVKAGQAYGFRDIWPQMPKVDIDDLRPMTEKELMEAYNVIIAKAEPEHKAFPKMTRMKNTRCTITEKIDGTNAVLYVEPESRKVLAGSRNRWLTPEHDNFGFARWVEEHKEELLKLPYGMHYGEWAGLGIQRGYGLKEKKLYLFNQTLKEFSSKAVNFVPVVGETTPDKLQGALKRIKDEFDVLGSVIGEGGFYQAEGVVVDFYQGFPSTKIKVIWDK